MIDDAEYDAALRQSGRGTGRRGRFPVEERDADGIDRHAVDKVRRAVQRVDDPREAAAFFARALFGQKAGLGQEARKPFGKPLLRGLIHIAHIVVRPFEFHFGRVEKPRLFVDERADFAAEVADLFGHEFQVHDGLSG